MTAPTLLTDRLALLEQIRLDKGGHQPPADPTGLPQGCLLEIEGWLWGQGWGDHPPCVSHVLIGFGIALNDAWDDTTRQQLDRFLGRLGGTAGDGQDEARGLLALDWLIRVYTPAWLRLVPALVAEADLLATAHRVDSLQAAADLGDTVRGIASRARSAWAAARDAALSAAGDAAWAAAWAATGDAARDAALSAARDAAWAAAWDAAGAAAGSAAGSAALSAAWDAAWDAALSAALSAAWDAAWAAAWAATGAAALSAAGAAARAALRPVVEQLQSSALDLFEAMLDPSKADQ